MDLSKPRPNRLKEFRAKRGLTMLELGNLCGVSAPAVKYWEAHGDVNQARMEQLAKIFGVRPKTLFPKGKMPSLYQLAMTTTCCRDVDRCAHMTG